MVEMRSVSFLLLTCLSAAGQSSWKAGAAKTSIVPDGPLWMAGYAARVKPSEGTAQTLWAKALALEDSSGARSVIVTADMLGFTRALSLRIAARVQREFGISRERLLLNASHTHCGPVIERQLAAAYDASESQWADVDRYTDALENRVVRVIGESLKGLQPVTLGFGRGTAGFARNRRTSFDSRGPVDHDVPVLRVAARSGKPIAVLFGYACHNTTLGGDYCKLHGDYAGSAQVQIEKANPGALAMFITGCGADANPTRRGSVEAADQNGAELADATARALSGVVSRVSGPLRAAYREVSLVFDTAPSRADLEARLAEPNKYAGRHARNMLDRISREGRLPTEYPYPVQVWRFGKDLTLVALAGEVVVDYTLRLKRELGSDKLWVAGYSNDVFAYIPSERVLQEGGYEGGGAMIYYGQPGPWAPGVEFSIIKTVHELVRAVSE